MNKKYNKEWAKKLLMLLYGNENYEKDSRLIEAKYVADYFKDRDDGLFERMYFSFEFIDPFDQKMLDGGWIIGFQYALSRDPGCTIPYIREGHYCNLMDLFGLTDQEEHIVINDQFHLGVEEMEINNNIKLLSQLLSESLTIFRNEVIENLDKKNKGTIS